MCKAFLFSSYYKIAAVLWVFLAVTGVERDLLFTKLLDLITFTGRVRESLSDSQT